MAATYDLDNASTTTVNRSKVRLYARDTNTAQAALQDAEWDVLIDDAPSGNLKLAAAAGLRMIALDTAKLGKWKEAGVERDAAASEAVRLARYLEDDARAEGIHRAKPSLKVY